jgi:flagellum-specific peptidoglycan hydrolase FlgJ
MKKYLFLLIALFPVISAAQTKVTAAEKYIAKYHELAIFEMQSTGIPASITLAQALHESANGTSQLAVKANNHFGVRCSSNWNGKRFYRNGNKKNYCFRKYNTVEEAYKDRSSFLSKNKKYSFLFKYSQQDYIHWAKGLQRAGYASSKIYAKQLINTIDRYNLAQYDKMGGSKNDSL